MTAKGWGGAVTPVREGVLTAVESVLTLDADFWRALGRGDAPEHVKDGTLRPDWRKRGFLRGWTDARYAFGRYFSPLAPNRPSGVDTLMRDNDVVLYDRWTDPNESVNLANDPAHKEAGLRRGLGRAEILTVEGQVALGEQDQGTEGTAAR